MGDSVDIDRALAEAGRAVEAPQHLRHRIRAEIDRSVRRRRAVASGALVALLGALGTGLWLTGGPPQAPQGPADRIAQAPGVKAPPAESFPGGPVDAPPAGPTLAESLAVTVRMTDPAMFAAPVRSGRPNVSIVRVYRDPTIEREAPDDPADQSVPAKPSSELETRTWQVEHGE